MAHIYDFNELRGSAEKIASHCVQNVLEGQEYDGLRVSGWTDDITNIAIEELSRLSPNFKYAVSLSWKRRARASTARQRK
jgi:hypothetical protein